ncbi:MAG: WbqC family protein [Pseudomonadota bacterium]
MKVVISQPMYFPWAGFMEMMALADIFIWHDDITFAKKSFTNRIQVKTQTGVKWMTIPLRDRRASTLIRDLAPAQTDWIGAHRRFLAANFAHYAYRDVALEIFDAATARTPLCELLKASCAVQADYLGVTPPEILNVSSLDVAGASWPKVLDMVKAVGGDRYISAAGGANYIDHEAFEAAGVSVEYMAYDPKPWAQTHGAFTPFVTGLDLIAAVGQSAQTFLRPATVPWCQRLKEAEAAAKRNEARSEKYSEKHCEKHCEKRSA